MTLTVATIVGLVAYAIGHRRGRDDERARQDRLEPGRRERWIREGERRARTVHPTAKHFDAPPVPHLVLGDPPPNVVSILAAARRRGGPQSVA